MSNLQTLARNLNRTNMTSSNPVNLYMECVSAKYTAQMVASAFADAGLANVSKVLVKPRSIDSHLAHMNRVHVEVAFWHESETAYAFLQTLQSEGCATLATFEWKVVPQDNARMFIEAMCDPSVHKTTLFREKTKKGDLIYSSKNQPTFQDGLTLFIDQTPDDGDLSALLPLPFCASHDEWNVDSALFW